MLTWRVFAETVTYYRSINDGNNSLRSASITIIISAMLPSMDRHADNTFCVSVSTGTSKVDKLLQDSISEGVIFQNFPGGMPPDPLVLCFAHYECKICQLAYM